MNEIVTEGRMYRYDPDSDCYYRVKSTEELSHWETYGWIYCVLALGVMCYVIESVSLY